MKECTNTIIETLETEFSSKTAAILTGQCENSDVNKIIDLIEYKNSELTFKLPVKPFSYIWVKTPCRYIGVPAGSDLPVECAGIFTEACENCNYYEKECQKAAYAEEKWFYLDSPYLTLVLNEFGKSVFENEEDCIKACKEEYNPEFVDKLTIQYHSYRDRLSEEV